MLLATTALGVVSAHAVDATWVGNNAGDPNEWNEPANWTGGTTPDGTATFTDTGQTTVANDNGIVIIGTVLFTAAPNALAYTFNVNDTFILNGSGVVNNSTSPQTFNVSAPGTAIVFQNGSSASGGAGTGTVTYNTNGFTFFQDTSTAGTATIINSGILQFNDNSTGGTAHITNNIEADFFQASSAGNATIVNNGTLTFNNTATAATATITNTNASIQFNNSATAGSANITAAANSIVTFSNSATAGGAHINNTGNAILTFNDSSSAGSLVFTANAASNGSINFNDSSTAATAHLDLVDTTLTFNNSSTASSAVITMSNTTHGGNIVFNDTSSAGSANITNVSSTGVNNTVQFLGASTAGNATIVNNPGVGSGGQLFFGTLGGTDTANAGTAHITNNSLAATGFLAHSSALNAFITNNSGGNTNFQDQSTAANATIVNNSGGTTTFGVAIVGTDTAGAGNANITNHAGGTTEFTAATNAGTATITNDSGGFLQFGDSGIGNSTATAANSTINNSGTTSFNAQTTAGSAIITTNSGGNVFFFDSSTGGNAQFITNAGGTFDMSGLTATGMTAGSIAGAGSYVLGAKTLTVGGNNLSTPVSGVISGIGGALTKIGTGTLTLSNTNTYTGATTVNGGTLVVDGSIAASTLTTVNPGGTLAGSGTVGNTAIAGGTLAPGSAASQFGPLTVFGSLTFTAASTYLIQVSPANAGLTNVTGTASLGNDTVSALFAPGSYVDRQYKILSAIGGFGGSAFNPTLVSNNPNITGTLSYDPQNVFLNIKLTFVSPGGLNTNQQNVANTLTNYFNTNGSIPANFAMLNAAGLTVASGELGTGVIQSSIKADDLFLNLLLDPTVIGRSGGFAPVGSASQFASQDDASAFAEKRLATPSERAAFAMATKAPLFSPQPANRWSVWSAGYGGSATTSGNAVVGSQDTTARVWGVVGGADYRVTPDTLVGFAVAGGGTNYSLANGLGSGSADLFQAGIFGRHNFGPAYISAALAYGWHDVTTNRTVALAGFDRLQARFRAETFSGRFEGGYRFATPFVGITPYAAAQVISFRLPSYAEQAVIGTPQFALNYASQTTTATRTELGLRADRSWALQDAMLTLRGRAAWAHDYNPNRSVTALFQSLPGTSFVVNGARSDPDAALVSAGAEVKWLNGFSLAGTFEGEFSGNTTSYAGKGVAKYSW